MLSHFGNTSTINTNKTVTSNASKCWEEDKCNTNLFRSASKSPYYYQYIVLLYYEAFAAPG